MRKLTILIVRKGENEENAGSSNPFVFNGAGDKNQTYDSLITKELQK